MKISQRYIEMNKFIQFWANICKQNPDYEINYVNVYNELIRLGVDSKDRFVDNDVNGNFDYWEKTFSNNINTKVFVAPQWTYFCQFINDRDSGHSLHNDMEYIKIYVPLDGKHILKGAQMIFEFLSLNDIKHLSKIGKHIRFDNIVIRVTSSEDALRVQKFIDNNAYIQEGLIPPNPFAFNQNGIAYVCDGKLSYNSTISKLITLYFKEKKYDLESAELQDFISFVYNYYENTFMNVGGLNRVINDFEINKNIANTSDVNFSNTLRNYKQIFELFLKSIDLDFNFEHLNCHFIENKRQYQANNDEFYQKLQSSSDNNFSLITEAYKTMKMKYGNLQALNGIIKYLKSGNGIYLTRKNNIRERILNSNVRIQFLHQAELQGITISDLLDSLVQEYSFH